MNEIAISIIVPVYNVELYLKDCLGSLMQQTYDSYEIILIDDKSSDRSLGICKGYVTRNKRIKILTK
jgi:glycosyltransferase involved in cell wall biosynthesis